MKTKHLLLIAGLYSLSTFGQTPGGTVPNKDYVTFLPSTFTSLSGVPESFDNMPSAIDITNNAVYITGYSKPTSGSRNYVLIKYHRSSGAVLWSKTFDYAGLNDRITSLAIDNSGNILVTGEATSVTNGTDIVTQKYDPNGNLIWSKVYNGSSNSNDGGLGIATDLSGDVYVCGYSSNTGTGKDFTVIKYNNAGVQQYVYTKNGTANSDDQANAIVSFGNKLYLVGNINNTGTNTDIYTTRLNSNNAFVNWSKTENGTANGADQGLDIKVQGNDVLVCGGITNTGTGQDYFFGKYNASNGNTVFTKSYNAFGGNDFATSLTLDASNTYAIVGVTQNGSVYEYHTAKYNNSGTLSWVNKHKTNTNVLNVRPKISVDIIANHFYVSGITFNTSIDAALYQITPGGNKSWTEYYDGAAGLRDGFVDLSIDDSAKVYVATLSEKSTSNTFDIVLIRYSQTPVYFPVGKDNEWVSPSLAYWENRGQLIDVFGSNTTGVKYYNTMNKPAFFYKDDNTTFFQFFHRHSNNTLDSIYRINLSFPERNMTAKAYPFEAAGHHYNFLLPHCDTSKTTGVAGYQRLFIPNFMTGIDMHYHFNQLDMKNYFLVKPGYSPSSIVWSFSGATSSTITTDGGLEVRCPMGTLRYDTILAYQVTPSGPNSFNLIPKNITWSHLANDDYTFNVSSYSPALPLLIEIRKATNPDDIMHTGAPDWEQLFASTSGGDEEGMAVSTDTDGNSYYTGWANPWNMPIGLGPGFTQVGAKLAEDIWVSKFGTAVGISSGPGNMDADRLMWTTIIGGSLMDKPYGITAYGIGGFGGKVYITGQTFSTDLFNQQLSGSYTQNVNHGNGDAFIISLDNQFGGQNSGFRSGSYFGGTGMDIGRSIKVSNTTGEAFLVGYTGTTAYSAQSCIGSTDGGFPNCNTAGIHYNYEGGATDGFIAKFNSNLVLQQTSFIGGDGDDQLLAVDINSVTVYAGGFTDNATNLPLPTSTLAGAYNQTAIAGGTDGYVIELSTGLTAKWGSLFGGNQKDEIRTLAIKTNSLVIGGYTESSTAYTLCAVPTNSAFPLCKLSGAFWQGTSTAAVYAGGTSDGFLAAFNENNSFYWGTYFGAWNTDAINGISIGKVTGNLYLGGTLTNISKKGDFTGYQNTMNTVVGPGNNQYYADTTNTTTGFAGWFNNSFIRNYTTLSSINLTQSANNVASFEQGFDKFYYMTGKTNTVAASSGGDFSYGAGNYGMMPMTACCPNAYNAGITYYGGANDAYVLRWNVGNMYMPIGINEITIKENNSIIAFPNPFTEGISFKSEKDLTKAILEIYDIQGRLLLTRNLGNFSHNNVEQVNLEHYAQGLYVLRIKSTEANATYKLIKQ